MSTLNMVSYVLCLQHYKYNCLSFQLTFDNYIFFPFFFFFIPVLFGFALGLSAIQPQVLGHPKSVSGYRFHPLEWVNLLLVGYYHNIVLPLPGMFGWKFFLRTPFTLQTPQKSAKGWFLTQRCSRVFLKCIYDLDPRLVTRFSLLFVSKSHPEMFRFVLLCLLILLLLIQPDLFDCVN